MPQFPSFYPQMNNGYGQPGVNPYMDRVNYWQQYQQNLQQPMATAQMSGTPQQINVMGKIVDSIDIVKATDIPMDGNMYYFPKADGTEVFGKQWLMNGQTRILTFKPVLDNNTNILPSEAGKTEIRLSEEFTAPFMKRFDELSGKIEQLEQSMTKSMTKNRNSVAKKDGDSE